MAWCWPGDKPLSEPMMVRLLMQICIIRPQWVKHLASSEQTELWIKWQIFADIFTQMKIIIFWLKFQYCWPIPWEQNFSVKNTTIFLQENAFKNFKCKMVAMLSRPQCVNEHWLEEWLGSDHMIGYYFNEPIHGCIYMRLGLNELTCPYKDAVLQPFRRWDDFAAVLSSQWDSLFW